MRALRIIIAIQSMLSSNGHYPSGNIPPFCHSSWCFTESSASQQYLWIFSAVWSYCVVLINTSSSLTQKELCILILSLLFSIRFHTSAWRTCKSYCSIGSPQNLGACVVIISHFIFLCTLNIPNIVGLFMDILFTWNTLSLKSSLAQTSNSIFMV